MAETITLPRGDTYVGEFDMTLATVDETLSDYHVWWTCKASEEDSDEQATFQKTLANGELTIKEGDSKKLILYISATETGALTIGTDYVWDLQIKHKTTGYVTTPINGTLKVTKDITKAT